MIKENSEPVKPGRRKLVFSDLNSMIKSNNVNDGSSFNNKNFENTTVENKTIFDIDFDHSYATNISFIDCTFENSKFVKGSFNAESRFTRCKFDQCYFQEMEFNHCKLEEVTFTDCSHFESYIFKCALENVSFTRGSCDTFMFNDCVFKGLKVSEVEVIPRRNMKNGINGTAWYVDAIPDPDAVKALSLLGVTVERKE